MERGPTALGRQDILAFVHQVDNELAAMEPPGTPHLLVITGGAVMAILGMRDTTHDIDSVTRLDPSIKTAAQRVAEKIGQDKTVLNDAGAAWRPATLDINACPTVIQGSRLTVRQVPIDALFIMKLDASRIGTMDSYDLAQLAPRVSYASAEDIQRAYEAAYPLTPDPDIGTWAWGKYLALNPD